MEVSNKERQERAGVKTDKRRKTKRRRERGSGKERRKDTIPEEQPVKIGGWGVMQLSR